MGVITPEGSGEISPNVTAAGQYGSGHGGFVGGKPGQFDGHHLGEAHVPTPQQNNQNISH